MSKFSIFSEYYQFLKSEGKWWMLPIVFLLFILGVAIVLVALLLGVTVDEVLGILDRAGRENLGLLLDVAHLHVSARSLGFDAAEFIRRTAPRVVAVHLSDNDGTRDDNRPVRADSWFWEPLRTLLPSNRVWILEAYRLTPDAIEDQIRIISGRTAGA